MTRPIVTVPRALIKQWQVLWDIDWRNQSGPSSSQGGSQATSTSFPRWVCGSPVFLRGSGVLQWRAIRAQAQGLNGLYRVPMCDPLGFRLTDAGASATDIARGLTFDDGAYFDDGVGWQYDPVAVSVGSFSPGATRLRIDTTGANGVAPKIGQIMSVKDWPFCVTGVLLVTGNVYDIDIRMALRTPLADGAIIDLQGWGIFEATDGNAGQAGYDPMGISNPVLSFQEVLTR